MKTWMAESTSYRDILRRGEMQTIRHLATSWFGSPSPDHLKRFERCDNQSEIDTLSHRLRAVASWDEFLEGI